MKKKLLYLFGSIYFFHLILTITSSFIPHYREFPMTELFIFVNFYQNIFYYPLEIIAPVVYLLTIILSFRLYLKYSIILGIIGAIVFIPNEVIGIIITPYPLGILLLIGIFYFSIPITMLYIYLNPNAKEIKSIRDLITNLSERFTKTHIKELREKTGSDRDLILKTIKEMISKKEINAEYFRKSKMVAFFK